MRSDSLTQFLGRRFNVVIDRPIGSRHPDFDLVYELNYGYVEGMVAADGEEQDVYVIGVTEPIERFEGRCIAVIIREDDVESKLVLAPDGITFSAEEIVKSVRFQERFFDSYIVMAT